MENNRIKYALYSIITIGIFLPLGLNAQYRIVTDPQTIATVTANLASQTAIENEHNIRLDSIASKQQAIEMYTVNMATIAEVYQITMENIKGFGVESRYYTEIGRCAIGIVNDVPELVKAVKESKWNNKILCMTELTGIVNKTQQLVTDFVNIVNNGKVSNPLKSKATGDSGKNDGYNLLDRYQRLSIANRIYTDLLELRYKIQAMTAMAQYATMQDLFFKIDPEGWANVMVMQNAVSGLINSWNNAIPTNWNWGKVEIDYSKLDPILKDILVSFR